MIALDPIPENPEFLTMTLDGQELDHVQDCETQDGWVFADGPEPFAAVELCGMSCETLREDEDAGVTALITCPPVSPGP